jgi:hypothetical protein
VAQTFDFSAVTNTVGAPSLRSLQGRAAVLPILFLFGSRECLPQLGESSRAIPKRNLRPAFIHSYRPGFVQKIKAIGGWLTFDFNLGTIYN